MSVISLKTRQKYGTLLAGNEAFDPGAFVPIATATGTGSSGTITFSSIPSTYQHLQVRAISRSTEAATGFTNVLIRVNGITSNNYTVHALFGEGSSVSAYGYDATSAGGYGEVGYAVRNNVTANIMGAFILDIHDYASTSKNKTMRSISGWDANGSGRIALRSSLFTQTNAIDSISLIIQGGAFSSNSTFALYGIRGN